MAFYYVPLGPRGLILRIGTAMLGLIGGIAYRRASRRRALLSRPEVVPVAIAVKR